MLSLLTRRSLTCRKGYAIVKGKGYHELEEITEKPAIHVTQYPMPQSIADFESEQVFLNRAYSTGLVERFAELSGLSAPLQIRIDTPTFNFRLGKSTHSVDRAQIEIDAVTENPDTLITIEAKIGVPTTFNTLLRRTHTITSWFKWIRNNLGIVEVDIEGNIRFSR